MDEIEVFSGKVKDLPGLWQRPRLLRPVSEIELARIQQGLEIVLPDDVKAFLRRGLASIEGHLTEDPSASLGFDFLDPDGIVDSTTILRNVVDETLDDDDPHARVVRHGVALTFCEPQLVVSKGAVYHFSFRNRICKVAKSFSAFLGDYLSSGCFVSGHFDALWHVVGAHV